MITKSDWFHFENFMWERQKSSCWSGKYYSCRNKNTFPDGSKCKWFPQSQASYIFNDIKKSLIFLIKL